MWEGGGGGGEGGGSVKPLFELKFHFHGKFWIIHFGYCIYLRYSHI